ncbi:MAG: hypothetical protein DHS20C18_40730 [Saprospiraceae bacterium]|nr:MAG: hypothetical protein DHS20C18_40730 [Saprospiraceae bacterium]
MTGEGKQLEEICDNAADDDGDGLIDLNDPDCDCPVVEPVSLIPNPSFEEMSCCPSDRSQLYCADDWIQASDATTDFLHTCGYMGWPEFPPPLPFPDGEGIVGFRDGRVLNQSNPQPGWKEYAGACLLAPLQAHTEYRFEFYVGFVNPLLSPPINITFFGTTDCENLPFGENNNFFGCPTNGPGWVKLGSTRLQGSNSWIKGEITVTPNQDMHAIVIGPDCPDVRATQSIYYFFDNLVLADERSFSLRIAETEHPCAEDFTLEIPDDPDLTFQWYKNGIALIGETAPKLSQMYGNGQYLVRMIGEDECQLTQAYNRQKPVSEEFVERTICEGDQLTFGPNQLLTPGSYIDTFKTIDNCDSIVHLELAVIGFQPDTVNAIIFEGEHYEVGNRQFGRPGEYPVRLTSSLGCDSLVILQLDHYHIYLPNVFSPNDDGFNDHFNVLGKGDLIEIQNLKVFNRWGALVYSGDHLPPSLSAGWDGKFNNQMVNPGIYVYLANVLMDDGKTRQFSGSVLVIR